MNREIVFSARDNNTLALITQIKQASDQLHRSLLNSGREEKRVTSETLKDYEKQISLLDKKKQSFATTKQSIPSQQSSAGTAFDVDRKKDDFLPRKLEDDCCKTQTEILREILTAIKETSQAQLTALAETNSQGRAFFTGDNLAGRRRIRSERRGDGGGIGDVAGALTGRGGGVGGMMSALRGGATAAALPLAIVAALAGGVITAFKSEMGREESLAQYSGLKGVGVRGINTWEEGGRFGRAGIGRRDRSSYGYSEEDFMGRIIPLARASGTTTDMNTQVLNSMALERGTSIDQGTIIQMERMARIMSDKRNSTDIVQSIFTSMAGTGAWGKDNADLSRLNELAQTFTQFTEGQFMRSGYVGTGSAFLNLRSQLERTGEAKWKRDDYAASTIEGLNRGLYGQGVPEAQAIKMDILRRANPEMGYAHLLAEQEKGIEAHGLLSGLMDLTNNMGGNIDQKALFLNQVLGGSMNMGDILSMLEKGVDTSNLDKQATGPSLDIEKRAEQATADLRDAMESLKGEVSTLTQQLLTIHRMMPATSNQLTVLVQGIDAIKNWLR